MFRFAIARLACAFFLGACGGRGGPDSETGPSQDPCSDFDLDVRKVWSEQTKVEVRASIMDQWSAELGADVAAQQAQSVETSMDRIASDWVMLRRSACLDHFKRGIGSDGEYQAKVGCFDRVLQRQRTALGELGEGSAAGLAAIEGLNQELASCR